MGLTPNYSIPYPDGGDLWDLTADLQSLADGADTAIDGVETSLTNLANVGINRSPNYIINGAFDINQRGLTSGGISTSGSYGFDRWKISNIGGTVNYSAQTFAAGNNPQAGIEATNYARIAVSGQTDAGHHAILRQPIENVRLLAGKTVTVSFWAKAASGTPYIAVTGEQYFAPGSVRTGFNSGKVQISTSWTRYSVPITIPSTAGQTIGADNLTYTHIELWVSAGSSFNSFTDSLGIQSNTFDIWGVQLEAGPIATPFRRNANSIQGELAACQRYYQRVSFTNEAPFLSGQVYNVNLAGVTWVYPVTMRVAPSTFEVSGTIRAGTPSGGVVVATASFASSTTHSAFIYLGATGGYGSGGQATQLMPTVGSYIAAIAEL